MCQQILEAVDIVDARDVYLFHFSSIDEPTRKLWITYIMSRPFGSPLIEWDVLSSAFSGPFHSLGAYVLIFESLGRFLGNFL